MSNDRLSDDELDAMQHLMLEQHELWPLTPANIRKLFSQAKSPAAQGAVAWRREEQQEWGTMWVYYTAKVYDDLQPLYAHPAPAGEREEVPSGYIYWCNKCNRKVVYHLGDDCEVRLAIGGCAHSVCGEILDLRKREPAAPAAPNATPHKVICHSPSERCGGCAHYRGEAPECIYAAAVVAPAKVGMVAEETCDSVRGVLQCIRNNPGVLMQNVHQHCDMRGDDMRLWPTWALAYEGYVTEASAARLIYDIMRAHIAQGKGE